MNPNRRAAIFTIQFFAYLISICVCVFLFVCFAAGFDQSESAEALIPETNVNPNTAPVSRLLCLPGISEKRARMIVEYRDSVDQADVFKVPQDLEKVRGIGPVTVQKMSPWLTFDCPEVL